MAFAVVYIVFQGIIVTTCRFNEKKGAIMNRSEARAKKREAGKLSREKK